MNAALIGAGTLAITAGTWSLGHAGIEEATWLLALGLVSSLRGLTIKTN